MTQRSTVLAIGRVGVVALLALAIPGSAGGADPGALDPSFGGDGVVVTELVPGLDADSGWRSIAIDSESRIISAGWTDPDGGLTAKDFVVARYLENGAFDLSFGGGDGYVVIDVLGLDDDDRAGAVIIDDLGRIYVGGRARDGDNYRFAAVRLLSDGSIDAGYGGLDGDPPGVASTDVHPDQNDGLNALALDSAGRLVAVGTQGAEGAGDFAVVRYGLDGDEDDSFDDNGIALANFGPYEEAEGVAIDSQGRIVAGGWTTTFGDAPQDMALARFTPAGEPDLAFSGDGMRAIDFDGTGAQDAVFSVAVADADSVLAAGVAGGGVVGRFAVLKLDSDGTDQPTFGGGDARATVAVQTGSIARGMALDAAGRILLGGTSSDGDRFSYAAARLRADGAVDPTFSADGSASAQLEASDIAHSAALDPNTGRMVVAGLTQNNGGEVDFGLVRFAAFETPPETVLCKRTAATIAGTDGRDKLKGTSGADVIYAGAGRDKVKSKAGADLVCGGAGRDTLKGQRGKDTLRGQRGRDRLRGGAGRDKLRGGPGKDSLRQ